VLGERLHVGSPRLDRGGNTISYPRLREMVENKRLVWQQARKLDGRGELVRVHEEIVGESAGRELPEPADKRLADQEPRVGFVLYDMSHADERGPICKRVELLGDSIAPQIDPADDALDEWMSIREIQEPAGFFEGLPRLHGNTATQACGSKAWREVVGEVVAGEPLHPLTDPRVLGRRIRPKMLVGVDSHEGIVHRFAKPLKQGRIAPSTRCWARPLAMESGVAFHPQSHG
jgi:hypothetical protein